MTASFANRLIAWQKQYGRHHLPWQNTRDPYAIWVSEIMLQQTQVAAVIGYYARFMTRFPDIASLASAQQEEVLQYWSGLGYYSRARHLHQAAQNIMVNHQGVFPQTIEQLIALPGIGKSTAAAIAAFAFGKINTILDGNVKRILARHFLIEGWPSSPAIENKMWGLAESLLPTSSQEMQAYTQGLMDLGATICVRSKPKCTQCPMQTSCLAYAQNRTHTLPTPKPRKPLPEQQIAMLMVLWDQKILLEKRPAKGIWGGLWSLPEISTTDIPQNSLYEKYGIEAEAQEPLATFTHVFTHYRLHIQPQPMYVTSGDATNLPAHLIWMTLADAIEAAIPSPVRRILQQLNNQENA